MDVVENGCWPRYTGVYRREDFERLQGNLADRGSVQHDEQARYRKDSDKIKFVFALNTKSDYVLDTSKWPLCGPERTFRQPHLAALC